MKNRWKRLAVVMGAAMMVVCQNGVIQVKAEETPVTEESVQKEETGDKDANSQKTEDDADDPVADDGENSGEEEAEDTDGNALNEEGTETEEPEAGDAETDGKEDASPKSEDDADKSQTEEDADPAKEEKELEAGNMDGKVTEADKEENVRGENVGQGKNDIESGETGEGADAGEAGPESGQVLEATDLRWENDKAVFNNPNGEGAIYIVTVYRDGQRVSQSRLRSDDWGKGGNVYVPVYQWAITESGTYTFEVETKDSDGAFIGKSCSAPWEYTKPQEQLSVPGNISWSKEGILLCEWTDEEYLDQYLFRVAYPGGQITINYGAEDYIKIENGYMEFMLNEYVESFYNVTLGNGATVEVMAVSRDLTACINSEWSDPVKFENAPADSGQAAPDSGPDGGKDGSSEEETWTHSDSSGDSPVTVAEPWKPATPDEMKRYAAYSREKVNYTADTQNSYPVAIRNAMQGKMCFDSFEAVLGDYAIGRTYNIFPANRVAYKMDSKARITLSIPKALQKAGREFKMVCVTANGLPIVLEDLGSDPGAITFETDTYYAFALIYKDAAASK